jgi:hypothetical protein
MNAVTPAKPIARSLLVEAEHVDGSTPKAERDASKAVGPILTLGSQSPQATSIVSWRALRHRRHPSVGKR